MFHFQGLIFETWSLLALRRTMLWAISTNHQARAQGRRRASGFPLQLPSDWCFIDAAPFHSSCFLCFSPHGRVSILQWCKHYPSTFVPTFRRDGQSILHESAQGRSSDPAPSLWGTSHPFLHSASAGVDQHSIPAFFFDCFVYSAACPVFPTIKLNGTALLESAFSSPAAIFV